MILFNFLLAIFDFFDIVPLIGCRFCCLTNPNDFVFIVSPPLLAKPSLFTNNNNSQANTLKKLPSTNGGQTVNGHNTHEYEPGHATEMLSQSVQKLKIADTTVDDFKTQAGKIITTMLENRLNEKNALNGAGKTNISIANGNVKSCDSVTMPAPPPKPFVAKLAPIIATADTNNDQIPLSPTHSLTDLPPPPAELIISNASIATDAIDYDAIDRKTISDINDNDILLIDDDHVQNKQCIDDTVSAAKILPQHRQQHQQHHNYQQNQQNGRNNGVVFRNKNTKSELTSHARDRRSYIGQDQCTPNRFNHNNHLITSHTTEIASDLRDGKHPICSVCHVKIAR